MYMLWFKFILCLVFFELVSIWFAIVPDYVNEYMTKENKNWTSFKNFAPKLNLNHNIYVFTGGLGLLFVFSNPWPRRWLVSHSMQPAMPVCMVVSLALCLAQCRDDLLQSLSVRIFMNQALHIMTSFQLHLEVFILPCQLFVKILP